MRGPWTDKTGLAKWVAIFATTLGIATGLCGLNFVSVLFFVPLGGGNRPPNVAVWDIVADVLGVGAFVELAVIAISLVALLVLAITKIARQLTGRNSE